MVRVFQMYHGEIKNDSLFGKVDTEEEYKVSIWTANNQFTRDFRLWEEGELWNQSLLKRNTQNEYKINLKSDNDGYTATMLEFIFNPDSDFPLILTTGPYVMPNEYPYQSYIPKQLDSEKND